MRYGSLTDFSTPLEKYSDIAKAAGLGVNTVWAVVQRYHKNGDCYVKKRRLNYQRKLSKE